jgi:hypothetical protein
MKRFFCTGVALLMTVFLSGCIQDTIVIHVKPDGSGTIEETFLLSNSMFDMMESIFSTMAAHNKKEEGSREIKDAAKGSTEKEAKQTRDDAIAKMVNDAAKQAESFGAAVKFVSAKPVKTDTASGYSAVYAFQDINQVMANQDLGSRRDGQKAEKSKSSEAEYLQFRFTKGSPAKLVVTLPAQRETSGHKLGAPDNDKAGEGKSGKEASAQSPEMMKNIFQDMKIKIAIQFEGTIINTNATYRDGSTVTLVEMDVGKLMTNADLFKQVLAVNPLSVGETKARFNNVEGLKFKTNNPVTVEFK